MAPPIRPVNLADPSMVQALAAAHPNASNQNGGSMFQEVFHEAVNTVQNFQTEASTAVTNLLSGASEDVHTPIIATQKADLSFELFMQVRNKVMSAYQTLMNMQV